MDTTIPFMGSPPDRSPEKPHPKCPLTLSWSLMGIPFLNRETWAEISSCKIIEISCENSFLKSRKSLTMSCKIIVAIDGNKVDASARLKFAPLVCIMFILPNRTLNIVQLLWKSYISSNIPLQRSTSSPPPQSVDLVKCHNASITKWAITQRWRLFWQITWHESYYIFSF